MFDLQRADGALVQKESTLRRFMPYLMPRRNDSVVYFEQTVDVTNVLKYLSDLKRKNNEQDVTFFHVFLACLVRTLCQWPRMNRFISGGKIYQRGVVEISFGVKKKMQEDAGVTAVKMQFAATDTVFDISRKVNEKINEGRSPKLTSSEKEMSIVTFLPGFMIRFLFWLQRALDNLNLLPAFMTKNDPLYASAFIANLGSLKLHAPFHHLYEYGTVSLFGVLGRIYKAPVVNDAGEIVAKDVVLIRWSLDERVTDGFYASQAFVTFEKLIQNPAILEEAP